MSKVELAPTLEELEHEIRTAIENSNGPFVSMRELRLYLEGRFRLDLSRRKSDLSRIVSSIAEKDGIASLSINDAQCPVNGSLPPTKQPNKIEQLNPVEADREPPIETTTSPAVERSESKTKLSCTSHDPKQEHEKKCLNNDKEKAEKDERIAFLIERLLDEQENVSKLENQISLLKRQLHLLKYENQKKTVKDLQPELGQDGALCVSDDTPLKQLEQFRSHYSNRLRLIDHLLTERRVKALIEAADADVSSQGPRAEACACLAKLVTKLAAAFCSLSSTDDVAEILGIAKSIEHRELHAFDEAFSVILRLTDEFLVLERAAVEGSFAELEPYKDPILLAFKSLVVACLAGGEDLQRRRQESLIKIWKRETTVCALGSWLSEFRLQKRFESTTKNKRSPVVVRGRVSPIIRTPSVRTNSPFGFSRSPSGGFKPIVDFPKRAI